MTPYWFTLAGLVAVVTGAGLGIGRGIAIDLVAPALRPQRTVPLAR